MRKHKNSSAVNSPHHPSRADAATCKLCGAELQAAPHTLMAHLLINHPNEFLESNTAQNIFQAVSRSLYEFGRMLTAKRG